MLYWLLKNILVGPAVSAIFRPWVEGLEHVPEQGGAIFASNHLSFSDSIFLPLVVPRRVTFPAKMEYFTGPGVKGFLTKSFFRGVGQIPIDRSGGDASMAALRAGMEVLRRGELFGIYPEGTRSPDGRLYRGKTGVARMALEAGVPVIPVAMIGTDKAQPTGQVIPSLHRVGVRFGAPMDFSAYAGRQGDHRVLRQLTDEVMAELQRLSGQEYVDEYASSAKERLALRARAVADQARVQAEQVREQLEAQAEHVREQFEVQAEHVREQLEVQAEHVREQIEQVREQAKVQAEHVRDQARERFARPSAEDAGTDSADGAVKDPRQDPTQDAPQDRAEDTGTDRGPRPPTMEG